MNLNATQRRILTVLADMSGAHPFDACRARLGVSVQHLDYHLKVLQNRGVVIVETDERGARIVRLTAT